MRFQYHFFRDGCPISPGFTLSKVYYLRPLLANNKSKRGLALDGQLKHEDTNLASSTMYGCLFDWLIFQVLIFFAFLRITHSLQRENLGIIVQYKVKVKLCLGPLGGDVIAELPFTLMHPKPEPEMGSLPELKTAAGLTSGDASNNKTAPPAHSETNGNGEKSKSVEAIDHNLIQLECVFPL